MSIFSSRAMSYTSLDTCEICGAIIIVASANPERQITKDLHYTWHSVEGK